MNEVVEKIHDRLVAMNLNELNALIHINYGEWRKNEGSIEQWNPAGSPSHAHDIMDKLLEDGLFINLFGRPEEWTCEILDRQATTFAEITSNTMARAICEAALIIVLTKYGEMIKV